MPFEQIAACAMVGLALLILILNDRQKKRRVRKAEERGTNVSPSDLNYQTSWGMVIAIIISVPVVYLILSGPNWLKNLVGAGLEVFLWVCGVLVVLVIAFLIYRVNSPENRAIKKAAQLATAGQKDEAVAVLREYLNTRGSSALVSNNLAAYLGDLGRSQEALDVIEQTGLGGAYAPILLINKGRFLSKLGKPQEAVRCIDDAVNRAPDELMVVCAAGLQFAEMRRIDDAARLLRRAQELFDTQQVDSKATRVARYETLSALRQKVEKTQFRC